MTNSTLRRLIATATLGVAAFCGAVGTAPAAVKTVGPTDLETGASRLYTESAVFVNFRLPGNDAVSVSAPAELRSWSVNVESPGIIRLAIVRPGVSAHYSVIAVDDRSAGQPGVNHFTLEDPLPIAAGDQIALVQRQTGAVPRYRALEGAGLWIKYGWDAPLDPSTGDDLVMQVGPEGAVAFNAVLDVMEPPKLVRAPSLSFGGWTPGSTVTATPGSWDNPVDRYDHQWLRCSNASEYSCQMVFSPDAEDGDATYTLTENDMGHRMRAVVTAESAAGDRQATTPMSKPLGLPAPTGLLPSVTGDLRTGDLLTASTGEWTFLPWQWRVEWLRCTTIWLNGCKKITSPDATNGDQWYRLVDADDAKRVRARVFARNLTGWSDTSAASKPTKIVDVPTLLTRPALNGAAREGQPLSTDRGAWTGDPTQYTVEWLRCDDLWLKNCARLDSPDATDGDLQYTPTAEDAGKRLRSRVQPRSAAGTGPATTSLYSKVVAGA